MRIREKQLQQVVWLCESMHGRANVASASSLRTHHASVFFEKALFHGKSMCMLIAPLKQGEDIDWAGVCTLARALIESHNVFNYLTESTISKAERDFRFALMNLNQSLDLIRISHAFGSSPDGTLDWFQRISKDLSLRNLMKNPVFAELGERERNHLLKGKRPYLMERYSGNRPIGRDLEAAAYNLFSHNVHSFGLSSRFGGSATPAGIFNRLFLAVEIAVIFLASMAKSYRALRARAIGQFSEEERELIAHALSLSFLESWMAKLRDRDIM